MRQAAEVTISTTSIDHRLAMILAKCSATTLALLLTVGRAQLG